MESERLSTIEFGLMEPVLALTALIVGVGAPYEFLIVSMLCVRVCDTRLPPGGGDAAGACGRGRRDCRIFLYCDTGLVSALERAILFSTMTAASLSPRLCPAYPLDASEESVLVRLSSNAPEEFEYAVEAVEAFEGWRLVVG